MRGIRDHRRLAPAALWLTLLAAGCGDFVGERRDAAPADAPMRKDVARTDVGKPADAPPANPDATDTTPIVALDGATGAADGAAIDTGPGPTLDGGLPSTSTATIVVLPDTQYYAAAYPSVFTDQTSWIVAQKTALNIAAVLHVGDIVDTDIAAQWTVANPAMRLLDNVVPYVLAPGNHDYSTASRKTMLDSYFPPDSMPWITGTMTAGQIDNNYALLDIGPQKWLVVAIEFGPRDAVVAWADSVLKTYAGYPAILLTHAYLYSDATRYDIKVGGTDQNAQSYQWWNPQYYGYTAADGINDGESMYEKLVLPNSNVRLVFCGHMTGWSTLTSTRPDGTTVHQMLSDYQWLDGQNYGFGYLRVVQLDYAKRAIKVQTYSPTLNDYLSEDQDQNQFTLDLNL